MNKKEIKTSNLFQMVVVREIFVEMMTAVNNSGKNAICALFDEILKAYSAKNRHYHDYNHISYMLSFWAVNKSKLNDPEAIFWAIIFHDIVYKARRKDNEEKSADAWLVFANKHTNLSGRIKDKVYNAILATKHNADSETIWIKDDDIKYLLDFDLEILGTRHESEYEWYRSGVRMEYKIYPDILYKPGRKKVLESFLARKKIYLTKDFQELSEKKARKNLRNEIKLYLC